MCIRDRYQEDRARYYFGGNTGRKVFAKVLVIVYNGGRNGRKGGIYYEMSLLWKS